MSLSPPGRTFSICLVAHFAYGALSDGSSGHIGGVERQTTIMARWLASRGHRVSLVTWDEGQEDGIEVEGVRVLKLCRREQGLRGLRFLHPRWTSLIAALRRADADLYYQNCAEYVTGQVALWSVHNRRKFIYSVAHDDDCLPSLPGLRTRRERILYRYGLRHADCIIVQTRAQRRMLAHGFALKSVVLPMPCPGPAAGQFTHHERPNGAAPRVLWIGRWTQEKRPDRFLDLVQACPDLKFDMVGPWYDDAHSRATLERARQLPNLVVHGAVTRERVSHFYQRAACLCSTSDHEGFPNTFLEAWSHGLPVVSTIDPDHVIAERRLGTVANDVGGLARAIRELFASLDQWRVRSGNAREYYLENHPVDRVMPRFEETFLDVAGHPRRTSPSR